MVFEASKARWSIEDTRTMMRENVGTIRGFVTKAPHFTKEEAGISPSPPS